MRKSFTLLCGLVLVGQGLLAGSVTLDATGSGTQRWLDTVDQLYNSAVAYGHAASFYDGASVTVTYDSTAPTFAGRLVATGLKPHFVYQMKLDGALITADFDDQSLASEALGYAGRWWLSKVSKSTTQTVSAWNSTDTEYEKWKDAGFQDLNYYYVFNGYLMFDYFVTDRLGTADLTFFLDSSFHVLWKDSQLNPPPWFYYPLGTHTIDPDKNAEDAAGVPWYTRNYRAKDVTIYGEIEHEDQYYNDQVGETMLPEGTYPVTFMLTEESFHSTRSEGGSWAGVLVGDVQFTVGTTIPVNRAPVANADSYSLTEGIVALTVSLPGVLGNDSDPDGDALTAVLVTHPTNGTVTLNPNGSFTYNVSGGFVVDTDYSFTYQASDGELQSEVATITITVNSEPANSAPTADAGAAQTVADDDGTGFESVTLDGAASGDSDGTIVSYVWSEGETNLGSGVTLAHSFPIGVHTITLTVTDNEVATDTDTVVVTVNEGQPPPASLVVADFQVSSATAGVNYYATAAVRVEDGNGPVAGATVTLSWNVLGKVKTQTGITAVDGTVAFTSAKTKNSGIITATITDVRTATVTWSSDPVTKSVTVP